jgi:hypothetical protein
LNTFVDCPFRRSSWSAGNNGAERVGKGRDPVHGPAEVEAVQERSSESIAGTNGVYHAHTESREGTQLVIREYSATLRRFCGRGESI